MIDFTAYAVNGLEAVNHATGAIIIVEQDGSVSVTWFTDSPREDATAFMERFGVDGDAKITWDFNGRIDVRLATAPTTFSFIIKDR